MEWGFWMKKNLFIFAVVIIAAFLCVGAVSASNVTNTTMKKTVSVSTSKNVAVTKSTSKIIKGSGCCSVLVHLKRVTMCLHLGGTLHILQTYIFIV